MSQITIYLPPEVEARARREARRARRSLSAYIASQLAPPRAGKAKGWAAFFGSVPGLEVPDDQDLLPLDEPGKR